MPTPLTEADVDRALGLVEEVNPLTSRYKAAGLGAHITGPGEGSYRATLLAKKTGKFEHHGEASAGHEATSNALVQHLSKTYGKSVGDLGKKLMSAASGMGFHTEHHSMRSKRGDTSSPESDSHASEVQKHEKLHGLISNNLESYFKGHPDANKVSEISRLITHHASAFGAHKAQFEVGRSFSHQG